MTRRDFLTAGTAFVISPAARAYFDPGAKADERPVPYRDAVLVDGEPPKPVPESFTIAVLPDTQHYSERFPETFLAQTKWIVENKEGRNVACVLHLGDITNRNTPREWENAVAAMGQLDGKLPYFFVPGNHDYSERGMFVDRTTLLNDYFPIGKFADLPTFGGVYDKEPDRMENSFHRFSAMGRNFVVIALEFGPRRDVVRWAREVAERHADREVILLTHAYLYHDDTRYDWKKFGLKQLHNPHKYPVATASDGAALDGEELWNELVSQRENFILTMNGHVPYDGLGRLVSESPAGRDVHQLLVNFQMRPQGGDGWLRLLEFRPDGRTVVVHDYSPTRKQRNESPQNAFELTLSKIARA